MSYRKAFVIFISGILLTIVWRGFVQERKHSSHTQSLAFDFCPEEQRFEKLEDALRVDPAKVCELLLWGQDFTIFPEEIHNFHNLKKLIISNNHIEQVPLWIGDLQNLIVLELSSNPLTKIPSAIGRLKQLRSIDLNATQITYLPMSFYSLTNLQVLQNRPMSWNVITCTALKVVLPMTKTDCFMIYI